MDVLFVGDNRNRANWGCRATSIALNQLIRDKHEIAEVVTGKEVGPSSRSDILYGSALPSSVYRRIERRRKYQVAEWYLELEQHFGARTDFVEEDPQRSVSNFHRARKSHQHLEEIYRKVKNCDAIVINGEGDLILTTPPRRKALFYLFLIELGLQLGKKVYYVNAMFSDCPVTGRNERTLQEASSCLERCEAVVWRDPTSRALYEEATTEAGGTAWLPDALFAWHTRVNEAVEELPDDGNMFLPFKREGEGYFDRFDFSEPYICIGGGSGAARDQQGSVASYERLVNALKKKEHPIYLVPASPGDSFLNEVADLTGAPVLPVEMAVLAGAAVLANATLFVSGRYHPSIMASLGGTPCIFLGSNSHKTESLQEIMEYETPQEFGAQPTDREVKRIVALADEYLSEGAAMRSKIHSTAARRGTEAAKILDVLAK